MKKQYLYAGVSIILWSTTATVTKLLLDGLNSMQILAISSFFAFLFLLIVNIGKHNIKKLNNYKIKDYSKLFIIGLLGTFFYKLFLYLGINKMQASQAFVINYLWPITTVIFACIILKEKMTFRKIIAILLSFVGVIIITSDGNLLDINKNNIIGALYCVIAAISYGLFSVLNKNEKYDKCLSMMLFYLFSFLISFIYLAITNEFTIPSGVQLIGLLWIGVFTCAIAFTSWIFAINEGDTVKISTLAYLTPFISLIWNCIILKESFNIFTFIGLIVIIFGILIQLKSNNK